MEKITTKSVRKIYWLIIVSAAALAALAYGADLISLNSPVTFPVDI